MKANELRIGNLLRDKVTKTELKVIELAEVNIITYVIDRSKFPLQDGWGIEPIPLTEEWLLKFGFTRHHDDYYNDIVFIKNVVNNYEFEWGVYPITLNGGIQINNRKLLKYVHQLQNLYFALTGEELTYGGNYDQV